MTDDQRFGGIRRLYGDAAYEKFRQSHICIIGIGGVGSWAAEALARSGIGHITLIDMDDVCITNTNRQIHALDGTVGLAKTDVMAQRVGLINPDCQVNCIEDFITPDNIPELLSEPFDYIIDCIDSIKPKAALMAWCKRNKRKVITVGGAGGQMDPTRIQIADLSRTEKDPLASKLRNFLRRYYNFSRNPKRRFEIECVFSMEQLNYPQGDGTVSHSRLKGDTETKMNCDTGFGASTAVTATFGFVAVSRVLDRLANTVR
ncbi:tRNA cyclic N6-threonylcarbamoyladenosine(37) synthase TcdA [Marinomonas sp. C2222]|uniref:tRNA cyclic N6-threonylcarbamoyladenosine(37) synthase TcdA n=1 Tax=Marinomonas sargassi TaxID=2984494 RepID=A0ABT2YQ83_9GAMM|nr:tRNA cyclic N6-threonylcarbamoyladenosine(37) synthase TcdA [Marinomonas sargassi]MCV2402047.1 tRNA cyclic N6-threonylcarbamoyladenosine(37) synthase TcdA [Marinomonas sargassi]